MAERIVYIISKAQYIKVGVTNNLTRRLSEYQGQPSGCTYPPDLDVTAPASVVWHASGWTDTEGLIMAAMYDEHVIGEWFLNSGHTALLLNRLSQGHALFPGRTAIKPRAYVDPAHLADWIPSL